MAQDQSLLLTTAHSQNGPRSFSQEGIRRNGKVREEIKEVSYTLLTGFRFVVIFGGDASMEAEAVGLLL